MPVRRYGIRNEMTEWAFTSGIAYTNPFCDVELDVIFTDPHGKSWKVPAFWSGDDEWRIRFTPQCVGSYSYETVCTDVNNEGLHGQRGVLSVAEYEGSNELLRHGSLRINADGRYLEHIDGKPFFWLADTWWMSLCKRLRWPDEFRMLTADRKQKGFTVIQLVAGLYPDMPYPDGRGANEAGFPWTADYQRINPEYFDMADIRIAHLVSSGIVPCIVGSWGYYLPWMGIDALKKHWRNLVARYGGYPVVWCLAGEGAMPYYLSEDPSGDRAVQIEGWTEIARYVAAIDPYDHPITIHPTDNSRSQVTDPGAIDFELLQTGHNGYSSIANTVAQIRRAYDGRPKMPVINGEVCYEGILEGSREEIQRFMFWSCMLSGAAGHTYGANGLWQLNRSEAPYGPSPHGSSWGDRTWQEAYMLPGSSQVAAGKAILERYPWWDFEPHREWVEPHADENNPMAPYAAGIPGRIRVVYFPTALAPWVPPTYLKDLEPDGVYWASYFDPKSGKEFPLGQVSPGADGSWKVPYPSLMQDWVLVLEKIGI